MDKNFETYWNDTNVRNIIYKACSRYQKAIDPDEMESIKMNTLWRCINRYDPNRGALFTTFLYQQLGFACKNELKKKRPEYACETIDVMDDQSMALEIQEIIHDMPDKHAKIIRQRYLDNMTMKEIGLANGYSRETARRRVLLAIRICKKLNGVKS